MTRPCRTRAPRHDCSAVSGKVRLESPHQHGYDPACVQINARIGTQHSRPDPLVLIQQATAFDRVRHGVTLQQPRPERAESSNTVAAGQATAAPSGPLEGPPPFLRSSYLRASGPEKSPHPCLPWSGSVWQEAFSLCGLGKVEGSGADDVDLSSCCEELMLPPLSINPLVMERPP